MLGIVWKKRGIFEALLLEVIDEGETRYAGETHLWAFKAFPARNDNLVCAVLVLESAVVVKTVMQFRGAKRRYDAHNLL